MRIDHLHLQDFRGFASFDLELHPEITLLVGRNGSGKTGILRGLAVALGAWFGGMSNAEVRGYDRTIKKWDARLTRVESGGLPTLEASYPVRVRAEGMVAGRRISWFRELGHPGGRTTHGGAKQIRELASSVESRLAEAHDPVALPVISYHAAGRLWVQKRDKHKDRLGSRLDGYSAALEVASDPKLFEAWMEWRESDRIQRIARASDAGQSVADVGSPHLEAVQEAARTCLEGARRFYYSANYRELRVEFDDGSELPFDRLSDGQRSLVAMAADIAWRCAQLNPFHGREAAHRTEGVVLIDEIELHLHPAWQRRVLDDLRCAFPRIQFVATTHSPQVIGAARREWIRLLVPGASQAFPVGHVEGRDTNAILSEVMGVLPRLERTQQEIDEIERAIADGELEKARQALERLREPLGDSDEAIRNLEWELRDLEVHGAHD
jgi:predicted ATP-binding protein involved in virulence